MKKKVIRRNHVRFNIHYKGRKSDASKSKEGFSPGEATVS